MSFDFVVRNTGSDFKFEIITIDFGLVFVESVEVKLVLSTCLGSSTTGSVSIAIHKTQNHYEIKILFDNYNQPLGIEYSLTNLSIFGSLRRRTEHACILGVLSTSQCESN